MFDIATKMFLCLLIAALIGVIIGYILGRLMKCENNKDKYKDDDIYSKYYQSYEKEENGTENNQNFYSQKPAMLPSKKEEVEAESIDEESEEILQKIVSEETGLVPTSHEVEKMKKPLLMTTPVSGRADDLKEISGIGIKLEKLLNELGIFYFSQIADWTEENLNWVDDNIGVFKGRAKRDKWVEQAKILANGGDTDFSKRVKKGEIDRY